MVEIVDNIIDDALKTHFYTKGYVVLSDFLHDKDLELIERRVNYQAPDQSLRQQYNQSTDSKRYEYSLSRPVLAEVLGKRRLREGEREEGGEETAAALGQEHGLFHVEPMTRVAAALCPQLRPAESFCIVSEAGSQDQPEHTDSIPNDDTQTLEEWQSALTYIGMLTPLQDVDAAYGQTALLPGSHTDPTTTEELRLSLRRGDVLVLDGRTVHRGLANSSTDPSRPPRKMCFFTYTLPGIVDGNAAAYGDDNYVSPERNSTEE